MNHPINVKPFGNWPLAESAIQQVQENTATPEQSLGHQMNNNTHIGAVSYSTGETKMVFLIPVEYNGVKYAGMLPDPVLLYLDAAHKYFAAAERLKTEQFPKAAMSAVGSSVRMFNALVDSTNDLYNTYLQCRVSAIIMLHSSLEAFVSAMMPDDISYEWVDKYGKSRILNKRGIDYKLKFREKLEGVMSFVSGIDLRKHHNQTLLDILYFYNIRNEFIHLKTYTEDGFKPSHSEVFNKMINLDFERYFKAIRSFMECLKPGYIQ